MKGYSKELGSTSICPVSGFPLVEYDMDVFKLNESSVKSSFLTFLSFLPLLIKPWKKLGLKFSTTFFGMTTSPGVSLALIVSASPLPVTNPPNRKGFEPSTNLS